MNRNHFWNFCSLFSLELVELHDTLDPVSDSSFFFYIFCLPGHHMKLTFFISPYDLLDVDQQQPKELGPDGKSQ